MKERFLKVFAQQHLLQPGAHFIAAVSGGIDSVVLCELCRQSGIVFSIAHCNFSLRGEESNRDEAFVRKLAAQYSVPVAVKLFKTLLFAEERKISIQEAARELRYSWFEALRQERGAAYVLLAHHGDDNIETTAMHFFRGTGLHGLTGIPLFTPIGKCIRPMLSFTRKEIQKFAEDQKLQWVEDSSNSTEKYTRNYFRHTVLPAVQQVYPQAESNLLDNIERFSKTEKLYNLLTGKLKEKLLQKKGAEYRIPVLQLMQYSDTSLIYEVIKDFGFTEKAVQEIIKLASSPSGKYIENDTYRIIRHRAWFLFSAKNTPVAETFIIEKDTKELFLPDGPIHIQKTTTKHFTINKNREVAQLDAKEIQYPLIVRRWKEGDYFYPLGMHKKKKLSRFFIDNKLSTIEKEKVWVVESRGRICWIIGYRIDDRFKINNDSQQVLQLTLTSH